MITKEDTPQMTTNTDTPRTDAIYFNDYYSRYDLAVLSKKLEREVARLMEQNQKLREIVERYRVWATSENPTQMELDDLKQKYDELN